MRRRVSDDEDDGLMEPVPAYIIKQQEAPFELYPLIELVDLDKKIPPRMKKHEFEPLGQSGGVFKNISITRSSWRWVDTVEYVIPETLTWPTSLLGFKPRWFDFDAIHAYERAANPTFFLDPLAPPPDTDLPTVLASVRHPLKTPEFYSAFRNIVISYYLSTASHFMPLISTVPLLEAASRRVCNNESYSLDLSDIIGLYDFFTHAGLVNFSCTNFTRTGDCKTFEEVQAARTRRDIPLGPFAAQIWRESDVHPVKSSAYSCFVCSDKFLFTQTKLTTLDTRAAIQTWLLCVPTASPLVTTQPTTLCLSVPMARLPSPVTTGPLNELLFCCRLCMTTKITGGVYPMPSV